MKQTPDVTLLDCRFIGNEGGVAGAVVLNHTRTGKASIENCVFEHNSGQYASFVIDAAAEMRISGCSKTFDVAPNRSNIALLGASSQPVIFFSGNKFQTSTHAKEIDGFHLYCTANAVWTFSDLCTFDADKNQSVYFLHGEPSGLVDHCKFGYEPSDKTPLSSGAIAGIVVFVLVLVLGLAGAVWFFVIRPRRSKQNYMGVKDDVLL